MAPVLRHCPCLRPENDDIKALDYSHSNLEDVPNEVFSFERTLEELFLEANQIKDLPRPLFHCHGLKTLNLSDNEVNDLPPAIASLINLEHLDISKNGIIEIPDNIKGCKCLNMVDASVNPLGKLPEGFTQLINLQELYLNDTFLEYLPANFGRLCRLRILELRENHLKVLPKSMARLSELSRLDIGQNDFSNLPDVIGNLPRLVELWCDNNNLNCLPPFLGGLKKLSYLDASKNRIYTVADEIEGCSSLCDLTLSSNRIKELPVGMVNLRKLTVLRVDSNRLVTLPTNIGNLISLDEFILSSNNLSRIPYTIGLLRNLKTLIADDNLLEEIPCEVGSCQKLSILSLRDNKLLQIPDELGHIAALKVINLSGNLLQFLPFSIAKLPNLQALWLSENQNKPLVPLQSDTDRTLGQKVLTCFMLPQVPLEEEGQAVYELKPKDDGNPEGKGRQLIKFAFDLEKDQPSRLVRAPTPYPKELKAHARHARNYALKKQSFRELDGSESGVKPLMHNMVAMGQKGAPPDIMVLPTGPIANNKMKVKEAVLSEFKMSSPPLGASRKELNNELKVNAQSSIESSGSDVAVKNLGRRDSRGDGSSSENTSLSPVGSPKAGSGHAIGHEQAANFYCKNPDAKSSKKNTWMRQRLVRQGSGDSDRGYRSDHEVYLVERDQYATYGTHSDGYASDWEAFMAKQNYSNNPGTMPMIHQYSRLPGSSNLTYRGNAEEPEVHSDSESMYWPGFQHIQGQENRSMGDAQPEMVLNQQGYWQTDSSCMQYSQNYDQTQMYQPNVEDNQSYYYSGNEISLQPAEFYQQPLYQPQQPLWRGRPPNIIGSRTLPRRVTSSSPQSKRAQCISVQAPLHSTPQEYHLMPHQNPNGCQVPPPNNTMRPSTSPRMDAKFAYHNAMPSQNSQYSAVPITSQPMNAIQFPTPPQNHPQYYPQYHDAQPSYAPMPPSPLMKHNVQSHAPGTEDVDISSKSYVVPLPRVHASNHYAGHQMPLKQLQHPTEDAQCYSHNIPNATHGRYDANEYVGFQNMQYHGRAIPVQMQNMDPATSGMPPMNLEHMNQSVPCINIIPSNSPPPCMMGSSDQQMNEAWKDTAIDTDSTVANTVSTQNAATNSVPNQSAAQRNSKIHEGDSKENSMTESGITVGSHPSNSPKEDANVSNIQKQASAQHETGNNPKGLTHTQGIFKAVPMRNISKSPQPDSKSSETQLTFTNPVAHKEVEKKNTSDYENMEVLQYHDYVNLQPVSSSSLMNFRKERAEMKNSTMDMQVDDMVCDEVIMQILDPTNHEIESKKEDLPSNKQGSQNEQMSKSNELQGSNVTPCIDSVKDAIKKAETLNSKLEKALTVNPTTKVACTTATVNNKAEPKLSAVTQTTVDKGAHQTSNSSNVKAVTEVKFTMTASDDKTAHNFDKRYQKVLPQLDKNVLLKSTAANSHSSPTKTNQKCNPENITTSILKSKDEGTSIVKDEPLAKQPPAVSPKPQIVPPSDKIVHSNAPSEKIANITQQLISCINRNAVEDAPKEEKESPNIILTDNKLENQAELIINQEKKMDSVSSNLASEDKVLNNKISSFGKIIATDQQENQIGDMGSDHPDPKKNNWFFGTHKNTLVFPVTVMKNPDIGFTIEGGIGAVKPSIRVKDNGIYVAQVSSNGPACGSLRPGDKILQANGMDFSYLHLEKATSFLGGNEPVLSLMVSRK